MFIQMKYIKGGIDMKKQHCVVMDDELSQELKIVAIKEGMSMSDLISKACVDYLDFRKQLVDRGIIFDDVRDMKPQGM